RSRATMLRPRKFTSFWCDGKSGLYIYPSIWHGAVVPIVDHAQLFSSDSARNPEPSMPVAETSGNDNIATLLDCCCGPRISLATQSRNPRTVFRTSHHPGSIEHGRLLSVRVRGLSCPQPCFRPRSRNVRTEQTNSLRGNRRTRPLQRAAAGG